MKINLPNNTHDQQELGTITTAQVLEQGYANLTRGSSDLQINRILMTESGEIFLAANFDMYRDQKVVEGYVIQGEHFDHRTIKTNGVLYIPRESAVKKFLIKLVNFVNYQTILGPRDSATRVLWKDTLLEAINLNPRYLENLIWIAQEIYRDWEEHEVRSYSNAELKDIINKAQERINAYVLHKRS